MEIIDTPQTTTPEVNSAKQTNIDVKADEIKPLKKGVQTNNIPQKPSYISRTKMYLVILIAFPLWYPFCFVYVPFDMARGMIKHDCASGLLALIFFTPFIILLNAVMIICIQPANVLQRNYDSCWKCFKGCFFLGKPYNGGPVGEYTRREEWVENFGQEVHVVNY